MRTMLILSVLGLVLVGCRLKNGYETQIVKRVVMETEPANAEVVHTTKTVICIHDDLKASQAVRYSDPKVYFNDSRLWGTEQLKEWRIDKGYTVRMYRPSEKRIVVRYTVGFNTLGKAEFHRENKNWILTACDLSDELLKLDARLLNYLKPQ